MTRHATADDLRRLRSGELPPAEILRITRHLPDCAACAKLAARSVNAPTAARHLAGALAVPVKRRVSRRGARIVAAAAIVAIALLGAVALWPRDPFPARPPKTAAFQLPPATPLPPAEAAVDSRWEPLVAAARRKGCLPIPSLAHLGGNRDVYRGRTGSAERDVFEPAGERIESTRPRFVWPRRDSSVVSVYRDGQEVLRSGIVRSGTWTASRELKRGRVYTWQVELADGTILPAPPQPQAMFEIVGVDDERELDEARRLFPNDHVLLAVLYARRGIVSRAAQELRGAPGDPDAVRMLRSLGSR